MLAGGMICILARMRRVLRTISDSIVAMQSFPMRGIWIWAQNCALDAGSTLATHFHNFRLHAKPKFSKFCELCIPEKLSVLTIIFELFFFRFLPGDIWKLICRLGTPCSDLRFAWARMGAKHSPPWFFQRNGAKHSPHSGQNAKTCDQKSPMKIST